MGGHEEKEGGKKRRDLFEKRGEKKRKGGKKGSGERRSSSTFSPSGLEEITRRVNQHAQDGGVGERKERFVGRGKKKRKKEKEGGERTKAPQEVCLNTSYVALPPHVSGKRVV